VKCEILEIAPSHDGRIAEVIKQVGREFGAVGEGFGPGDAEVENMSHHYRAEVASLYLVALVDGKLIGGGGVAWRILKRESKRSRAMLKTGFHFGRCLSLALVACSR